MKILKEKVSLFFRHLDIFLKKEHKIQTAYIYYGSNFCSQGQRRKPPIRFHGCLIRTFIWNE